MTNSKVKDVIMEHKNKNNKTDEEIRQYHLDIINRFKRSLATFMMLVDDTAVRNNTSFPVRLLVNELLVEMLHRRMNSEKFDVRREVDLVRDIVRNLPDSVFDDLSAHIKALDAEVFAKVASMYVPKTDDKLN